MRPLALCLALALAGCQTPFGQSQGQGTNENVATAGQARATFKSPVSSDGNLAHGRAEIPLVYRDANGVVHPVLGPDGAPVISRVEGSGLTVYVNAEVTNTASNTVAGTVEGSSQSGSQSGPETKVDANVSGTPGQ